MRDMRLAADGSHPSPAALRHVPKVDKGIPMPPPGRRGREGGYNINSLPWRRMDVGDSFIFPRGRCRDLTMWHIAACSAARRRTLVAGEEFVARILDGAVRIWRAA